MVARVVPPASPGPSRPAGPTTRTTLPPPLVVPTLVRPLAEHRIDEAQATALLVDRLAHAAQRQLFARQQADPAYVPRVPSADQIAVAAALLLADPAFHIRLALLAGSFREPPVEPALRAVPTAVPPIGPPAAAVLAARIAAVNVHLATQAWAEAEVTVRDLPEAIRGHWDVELARARAVDAQLRPCTHPGLDRAHALAQVIDSQPVRESLEARIAALRSTLPPPEPPVKPTRTARVAPGAAAPPVEIAPPVAPVEPAPPVELAPPVAPVELAPPDDEGPLAEFVPEDAPSAGATPVPVAPKGRAKRGKATA